MKDSIQHRADEVKRRAKEVEEILCKAGIEVASVTGEGKVITIVNGNSHYPDAISMWVPSQYHGFKVKVVKGKI